MNGEYENMPILAVAAAEILSVIYIGIFKLS